MVTFYVIRYFVALIGLHMLYRHHSCSPDPWRHILTLWGLISSLFLLPFLLRRLRGLILLHLLFLLALVGDPLWVLLSFLRPICLLHCKPLPRQSWLCLEYGLLSLPITLCLSLLPV